MPSSRSVRKIRIAISPRFATRTFRKNGISRLVVFGGDALANACEPPRARGCAVHEHTLERLLERVPQLARRLGSDLELQRVETTPFERFDGRNGRSLLRGIRRRGRASTIDAVP